MDQREKKSPVEAKWPGPDVEYSTPTTSEVKNNWRYTSAPPMRLHEMHRESFTFTGPVQ
jgi:hypothetical protein